MTDSKFFESCLVFKDYALEGFQVNPENVNDLELKDAKYFTDSRYKILIDNTAPYGHFMTDWLYRLAKAIDTLPVSPENLLVLFHRSPEDGGLQLNHMATLTEFLANKLKSKGYGVDYGDTRYLHLTNYFHVYDPSYNSYAPNFVYMPIVRRFLTEDITTSSYGRKIYLSRSKTTTSNGNRYVDINKSLDFSLPMKDRLDQVRTKFQYRFSNRLDDEQRLEDYLKSLGFEILVPEDFDSYKAQLNYISEARIFASITSSGIYGAYVLNPNAAIVEFITPFGNFDGDGEIIPSSATLEDSYRILAMIQGNRYVPVSNLSRKVDNIINQIESDPNLKALLSS